MIVHLVVNVEHWRFDAAMPRTIITPPHGKETIPDVPNFGWVDYGMRCGLPRMIDAIAARGLAASTSINASVIDTYPRAAAAMLDAGWEFIGHGLHQRSISQATDERSLVLEAVNKLQKFTGEPTRGWLSPGLRESTETPEILAESGIDYVCDWVVDDVPTWMTIRGRPLLAMPYNLELNDSIIYAIEKHSSPEFLQRLIRSVDLFRRETSKYVRVLALGLHPHLMGVPHRFGHFEEMLDLLQSTPGVCFMKGSQIADWYKEQVPPPAPSA